MGVPVVCHGKRCGVYMGVLNVVVSVVVMYEVVVIVIYSILYKALRSVLTSGAAMGVVRPPGRGEGLTLFRLCGETRSSPFVAWWREVLRWVCGETPPVEGAGVVSRSESPVAVVACVPCLPIPCRRRRRRWRPGPCPRRQRWRRGRAPQVPATRAAPGSVALVAQHLVEPEGVHEGLSRGRLRSRFCVRVAVVVRVASVIRHEIR